MNSPTPDLEALITRLETLSDEFEEDHTAEFLSYLDHESPEVRSAAVRGLWDSDPMEVLDALYKAAKEDEVNDVRATALSVMGRYVYEGVLLEGAEEGDIEGEMDPKAASDVRYFLEKILHDESQPEILRRRAMEALSFDPGPEEEALLEAWYRSSSPELRMSAVFSMGRSGSEQWDEKILRALDDETFEVRREAIRAVAEVGLEEGVPKLESFLTGDNKDLKLEAIAALGMTGGPEAIGYLSSMLESADEEVAELAEAALEAAEEVEALGDYELEDGLEDEE